MCATEPCSSEEAGSRGRRLWLLQRTDRNTVCEQAWGLHRVRDGVKEHRTYTAVGWKGTTVCPCFGCPDSLWIYAISSILHYGTRLKASPHGTQADAIYAICGPVLGPETFRFLCLHTGCMVCSGPLRTLLWRSIPHTEPHHSLGCAQGPRDTATVPMGYPGPHTWGRCNVFRR